MNLFIYGSGGNGCELSDIAKLINQQDKRWGRVAFVDDIRNERIWYKQEVLRFENMLLEKEEYECIISLGEPAHRKTLYEKLLAHKIPLATLIHPDTNISPSASIGKGCIVGARSFVSSNTEIRDNVMIEVQTAIGHDIFIDQHTVISSCSVIGANTLIGSETFIGLNCSIKENTKIGNRNIIGMGSCVFKDVDDGFIILGNPARPVKKNESFLVFKN